MFAQVLLSVLVAIFPRWNYSIEWYYLFVYLRDRVRERARERELFNPSTDSLLKWLQWLGMEKAKARNLGPGPRSQGLLVGLPREW